MARSTDFWAGEREARGGTFFFHFYPRKVYEITFPRTPGQGVTVRDLREGEESPYYAWWDNRDERFHMVYRSAAQVRMCSPDAFVHKTEIGEGEIVNVAVNRRDA